MKAEELPRLAEPFPPSDLEWRVLRSGNRKDGSPWAIVIPYIDARAIVARLNEVCGPAGWWNERPIATEKGVIQGVTILVDEKPITRWDGADYTRDHDDGDASSFKGGCTGGFKRATRMFGIGDYLCHLDTLFADIREEGKFKFKGKDGAYHKWNPPSLPDHALPKREPQSNGQKPDIINPFAKFRTWVHGDSMKQKLREAGWTADEAIAAAIGHQVEKLQHAVTAEDIRKSTDEQLYKEMCEWLQAELKGRASTERQGKEVFA